MEKSITEIQKDVDEWAGKFEKPYFSPLSMVATMTEEVGELARVMNILYGDKNAKNGENIKDLQEELGDVLFTIICIANREGISLHNAFQQKWEKLNTRDKNRFKKKEE